MKKFVSFRMVALAAAVAFCACASLVKAAPADLNLRAQLVWGTNKDKPDNPNLKEVDTKVTDKLRGVFKWKSYFEVNQLNFTVGTSSPRKVKMSEDCEIEVQNLGNSSIEVKLYGKGKMVVRKTQKMKATELLVLAGDDKDDTAWFVVLSQPEK